MITLPPIKSSLSLSLSLSESYAASLEQRMEQQALYVNWYISLRRGCIVAS